jgi:ergothioneine biosynthesis protein EgtB
MNQVDQNIITDRYLSVREYSEEICLPLEREDYVVQPDVEVSPPKWHLAHITWFWEEFVLTKHLKGYKRFHPRYAFLFNSYYNAVGDRVLRLHRGNMSRPTVDEILTYRKYVDEHMIQLLENTSEELTALVELGINHEQQHQELLFTDIKYILGHNPLFPAYRDDFIEVNPESSAKGYVAMQGGKYEIGFKGTGFCFDNECSKHEVLLNDFSISKSLVSNAEYLKFMQASGYEEAKYWHSDGWDWVNKNDIHAPLYWYKIDGEWYRYALSGLEKIKPDEPVTHISFYEAAAFAEWSGHRLPTEFEWEAACDYFEWGSRWEHTNSAYLPYPGFEKPEGAIGEYNGKFMVNQMVLRGASIVTPAGHSRKTYRNFFHPQQRWQFNGIRLCKK